MLNKFDIMNLFFFLVAKLFKRYYQLLPTNFFFALVPIMNDPGFSAIRNIYHKEASTVIRQIFHSLAVLKKNIFENISLDEPIQNLDPILCFAPGQVFIQSWIYTI